MNEARKVNLDEFLLEALLSQQNRTEIAIHLFHMGKANLIATQIEDIHFHSQAILEKYCIIDESKQWAYTLNKEW